MKSKVGVAAFVVVLVVLSMDQEVGRPRLCSSEGNGKAIPRKDSGAEQGPGRFSEREPAGSLGDKFNVIGGWLPSLTLIVRQPENEVIVRRLGQVGMEGSSSFVHRVPCSYCGYAYFMGVGVGLRMG